MDAITKHGNEQLVSLLYKTLLNSWNNANAAVFAGLFTKEGNVVGFDGSQMNGQKQIEAELEKIFASHKVSSYISIVKEIRQLDQDTFLLRAVAGMVPPAQSQINPAVNAIQTMIARKENGHFHIELFQNTPAAFHGRPELADKLNQELQESFNNLK